MSNEIKTTLTLSANKGYLALSKTVSANFDMTGDDYNSQTVSLTTTASAITLPASIATTGWSWARNLSTTVTLQVGVYVSSTFYPFLSLLPGEAAVFPLATTTPYGKSVSGTGSLELVVFER